MKDQMDEIVESSNVLRDSESVINTSENNLLDKVASGSPLAKQLKLDAVSEENASVCNTSLKKKKRREKIKEEVNVIAANRCTCMQQTEMSMGRSEELVEIKDQMNDNVGASDNLREHLTNNESETNLLTKDVSMLNLAEHPELDDKLVVNASEGTQGIPRKKRRRKANKVNAQNEVQVMDETLLNSGSMVNSTEIIPHSDGNREASVNERVYNAVNKKLEMNPLGKDVSPTGHSKLKAPLTVNQSGVVTDTKMIESQSMDHDITGNLADFKDRMDRSSMEHIRDFNMDSNEPERSRINEDAATLPLSDHPKPHAGSRHSALAMVTNEVQSMNQTEMNTGTARNLSETKDQIDHRAEPADKIQDCNVVNNLSENKFLDNDATLPVYGKNYRKHMRYIKNKKAKAKTRREIASMNPADAMYKILQPDDNVAGSAKLSNINSNADNCVLSDGLGISTEVSSQSVVKSPFPLPTSMDLDGNSFPSEKRRAHHLNQANEVKNMPVNQINEVNNEFFTGQGNYATEDGCILSPSRVAVTQYLYRDAKEEKFSSHVLRQYPTHIRRKLLVLDVNGLLAHIVMPAPKDRRGDTHILGRAVFKRPFCDDFLNFCFQNFDVGIWSSRSKVLIDRVVDYLLGNRKNKLLFCWNMLHATQTGYKTLENLHKPLVCKELRKIWEGTSPDSRCKKGDYYESNTLLLDDSPYKALLNPLHTAIFPQSFCYEDNNDNSLGPGGDLRVYLEGLLACDNVQKYVEQNPFGQGAINEANSSWEFYSSVLQSLTNQSDSNCLRSLPTQSQDLPPMPNQVSVTTHAE